MHEIEIIYIFNFKNGINIEAMEKPNMHGIIFYEVDLEAVILSHNDPMIITTLIKDWQINRLLVDEGSAPSLLYLYYWSRTELQDDSL